MMREHSNLPPALADLDAEYEIIGEIGRGGMAVVYLAREREGDRMVAIKVVRAKYVEDEHAVARFAREARTVAQLQHPSIVTIHAVKRLPDRSLALVMQYVPGRTLKMAVRQDGPFRVDRAERVLRDIGEALAYAHQRGIVHRDVKPENIFLDETSGRALLSDFGIARSMEADANLTLTGMAIGTPAYMSPEQVDGAEIDGRSDIYSLGLVAWEMLAGARPWEGESLYSVIYRQKHDDLPPLDEIRPDVPPRVLLAIEGALQKDRSARWASAEEFLAQLESDAPKAARRKRRRSKPAMAAHPETPPTALEAETVQFRRSDGMVTGRALRPAARRRAPRVLAALALPLTLIGGVALFATLNGRDPSPQAVDSSDLGYADPLRSDSVVPGIASETARPAAAFPQADTQALARADTTWPSAIDSARRAAEDSVRSVLAENARRARRDSARLALQDSVQLASADSARRVERDSAPPRTAAPAPTGGGDSAPRVAVATTRSSRSPTVTDTPTPPARQPPAGREISPAPPTTGRGAAGTTPSSTVAGSPRAVAAPTRDATIVAAGGMHTCVVESGGQGFCWGGNDRGQLGTGGTARQAAPVKIAGNLRFVSLSPGTSHTCGISDAGAAYCWGANDRGQLGDGSNRAHASPVPVAGGHTFRVIRTGMSHTCGITQFGSTFCWGANSYGQLGDGTTASATVPSVVAGSAQFDRLAVGWNHTCGLTPQGDAYCWGQNSSGQLGDGTRTNRPTPTHVVGAPPLLSISTGGGHTCGVAVGGALYCWGRNTYGQLGDGSTTDRASPARVPIPGGVARVAVGSVHTCGLTRRGEVYCWGRNSYGQLGDGTTADRATPVRVRTELRFASIQAGGAHTCGATSVGDRWCWGYNVAGQIGDGTRSDRPRPVPVGRPRSS